MWEVLIPVFILLPSNKIIGIYIMPEVNGDTVALSGISINFT